MNTRWRRSSAFRARSEIAALGLDRFTEACRRFVLRYADEWESVVTRLGRWVDFEDAYKTMDRSYMDSVLWAFHRLHELGLLYEGHKVVPYCCRCQTPLSNFEARLDDAYRPRTDVSCIVKFRLRDDATTSFLAWTTTPWTLPSNVALAVNPGPGLRAVSCRTANVCGLPRTPGAVSAALRATAGVNGRELVGLHYKPVFPYFASLAERSWSCRAISYQLPTALASCILPQRSAKTMKRCAAPQESRGQSPYGRRDVHVRGSRASRDRSCSRRRHGSSRGWPNAGCSSSTLSICTTTRIAGAAISR